MSQDTRPIHAMATLDNKNDLPVKVSESETGTATETLECGSSLAEWAFHSSPPQPNSPGDATPLRPLPTVSSLRSLISSSLLLHTPHPTTFASPYHPHTPLVYTDHTASSLPLSPIESYIQKTVLPFYGNTHTLTSVTGSQSTAFVSESRQIVAEATNAKITGKASADTVLFGGHGSTGAVELLLDCLLGGGTNNYTEDERPVVFVGPAEHHSNLVPWRESGCEIVTVPETSDGSVDLEELGRLLSLPRYGRGGLRIGTFSAASNVTGTIADADAIASLLHRFGALAVFDHATAASYLSVDMNPSGDPTAYKDAVFFSPHKVLGGVNTPGVLIIKKSLVSRVRPPKRSGGGTVFWVSNQNHRFLSKREERYEGGSPDVVGIVRVGMTFLTMRRLREAYKQIVTTNIAEGTVPSPPATITDYDCQTFLNVYRRWKVTAPNLVLMGSSQSQPRRLPIFSFLIRCGRRFLHYNFVCAILNDLFGIQSRGGCQCAGPYSQRLLGLTVSINKQEVPSADNIRIENALISHKEKAELLRPGYTRLSLPFKGLTDAEVEYVMKAVELVAEKGWRLLPSYRCNHRTGEWRHWTRQGKPLGKERRWISHFDPFAPQPAVEEQSQSLDDLLQSTLLRAERILEEALQDKSQISQAVSMKEASGILEGGDELEELRWYVYPKEAAQLIRQGDWEEVLREENKMDYLGALRPRDCSQVQSQQTVPDSIVEADFDSTVDVDTVPKRDLSKIPNILFKDGEDHTGQATFHDIQEGYEEGELSENCLIYSLKTDEWISIEEFLQQQTEEGPEQLQLSVTIMDDVPPQEESEDDQPDPPTSQSPLPEIDEEFIDLPDDPISNIPRAAASIKKQSRDSSTWGKSDGILTAIPPPSNTKSQTHSTITIPPKAISTRFLKRGRIKPPPKMMRLIIQAIIQHDMIKQNDNLLLGLSGGKDSLCLLHCLLEYKRNFPIDFTIQVCTIDPMTPSFDPSPLIPYVRDTLGLAYHYIEDDIVARASQSGKGGGRVSSLCAYCARMKRGLLYSTARKAGCNKLVLAQHLDDCAESFLMSAIHNGFLRTMKANYEINDGDLSVIRPMVYCRESYMTEFAKKADLPVINENCPACFEEPKERARIKKLLAREETLFPDLYDNLRRAMIPLMHEDLTSIMRFYTEETVKKSVKVKGQKNKKVVTMGLIEGENVKNDQEDEKKDNAGEDLENLVKDLSLDSDGNTDNKLLAQTQPSLMEASEEQLVAELAKRRALKYKLHGSMKPLGRYKDKDGQVCTVGDNDAVCTIGGGANGDEVPCYELM